MIIIILGSTGYLGKRIAVRLANAGHSIYCVKREHSDTTYLKGQENIMQLVNINDIDKILDKKVDWIINMICLYERKGISFSDIINSNLNVPLNILNRAIEKGIRNFITIDTSLPKEFNFYSFSKKMLDEFGKFYVLKKNITFYNLVLEMFYGPEESIERFIPYCIYKLRNGEDIALTQGTQKRDIIYIEDVIEAIYMIILCGIKGYKEFQIGTGQASSILDIVQYLKEQLKSESVLKIGEIPMRKNEPNSVADISNLISIGFKCKYSWKEGLKDMLLQQEKDISKFKRGGVEHKNKIFVFVCYITDIILYRRYFCE